MSAAACPRSTESGFTLLEVLIAMVIIAISVLGIAGLQLYSIKNIHSSNERVQAALHAYSIVDSMRANPDGVVNGFYDITEVFVFPSPLPDCIGIDKNCSTQELAMFDLYRWKQDLNTFSASGNGRVESEIDALGRVLVTVVVSWHDPLTTDETRSEFSIGAQL